MNKIRASILQKLMHAEHLTFNKLWNKTGESNKFAYHLKVLEEDGLLSKSEHGYELSEEGKSFVTFLDGETGQRESHPLSCVAVVIFNEDESEVLLQKRLKIPFYGVLGFPSGKIRFDENILDCAKREAKEELGLDVDVTLRGLTTIKSYVQNELKFSHQLFIVRGKVQGGSLIETMREGENMWVKISEAHKHKVFSNFPCSLKIAQGNTFHYMDLERHDEGDESANINILTDMVY